MIMDSTSISYIANPIIITNILGTIITGLGWLNYITLEDKDRLWEEWENTIESGKEISTYYTIKNPQTMDLIPVKCRAVINRDSSNIVSIIGTLEKFPIKDYKKLNIA